MILMSNFTAVLSAISRLTVVSCEAKEEVPCDERT